MEESLEKDKLYMIQALVIVQKSQRPFNKNSTQPICCEWVKGIWVIRTKEKSF